MICIFNDVLIEWLLRVRAGNEPLLSGSAMNEHDERAIALTCCCCWNRVPIRESRRRFPWTCHWMSLPTSLVLCRRSYSAARRIEREQRTSPSRSIHDCHTRTTSHGELPLHRNDFPTCSCLFADESFGLCRFSIT